MTAPDVKKNQKASVFKCLPGKKILAITVTCLLTLFLSLSVHAQTRVRGRITGETGQPVPKASVVVQGTTTGVSSDDNGNFDITAPTNGTLVVSSVDFTTQEIKINGRTTINVTLVTLEKSLGEVVVIGYGTV